MSGKGGGDHHAKKKNGTPHPSHSGPRRLSSKAASQRKKTHVIDRLYWYLVCAYFVAGGPPCQATLRPINRQISRAGEYSHRRLRHGLYVHPDGVHYAKRRGDGNPHVRVCVTCNVNLSRPMNHPPCSVRNTTHHRHHLLRIIGFGADSAPAASHNTLRPSRRHNGRASRRPSEYGVLSSSRGGGGTKDEIQG